MKNDSFSATWVSHSSISDFLKCPKAYYLHNVYKNPQTRNKIALINPPMALGQTVHEVLESLSTLPVDVRFNAPLLDKYNEVWEKVSGKKGGFKSKELEEAYKDRGRIMLQRVIDKPGPLANKAVIIRVSDPSFPLPKYYISKEQNIILCGKIDWMEYIPETDSVHIIDFKTGKQEEDPNSLQLAIYCLLVQNLQKRKIHKVSYWYLDRDNEIREMQIPDLTEAKNRIIDIALRIKTAKANRNFECAKNGCYACKPYLAIINGEAEYVGKTDYQDVYVI